MRPFGIPVIASWSIEPEEYPSLSLTRYRLVIVLRSGEVIRDRTVYGTKVKARAAAQTWVRADKRGASFVFTGFERIPDTRAQELKARFAGMEVDADYAPDLRRLLGDARCRIVAAEQDGTFEDIRAAIGAAEALLRAWGLPVKVA
jgi:hypothetical protein